MNYLLTEKEILNLYSRKVKPAEVLKSEKIALLTWSGEDVKLWLDENKKKVSKVDFESFILKVIRNLEYQNCAECLQISCEGLK